MEGMVYIQGGTGCTAGWTGWYVGCYISRDVFRDVESWMDTCTRCSKEDGQHVETWCYLLEQHMVDVVYLGGDGGIPGWYAGGVGAQGVCTPARMGWLSLVTASPHLIWNTCPDTDEGAGLADAPQRTHSMATYTPSGCMYM